MRRINASPSSITAASTSASPISTASSKKSIAIRYSRSGVISTMPSAAGVGNPYSPSMRSV
jgi:hypothetical protein